MLFAALGANEPLTIDKACADAGLTPTECAFVKQGLKDPSDLEAFAQLAAQSGAAAACSVYLTPAAAPFCGAIAAKLMAYVLGILSPCTSAGGTAWCIEECTRYLDTQTGHVYDQRGQRVNDRTLADQPIRITGHSGKARFQCVRSAFVQPPTLPAPVPMIERTFPDPINCVRYKCQLPGAALPSPCPTGEILRNGDCVLAPNFFVAINPRTNTPLVLPKGTIGIFDPERGVFRLLAPV
jgi:hypothetical protein